jgi:hypothetical protein
MLRDYNERTPGYRNQSVSELVSGGWRVLTGEKQWRGLLVCFEMRGVGGWLQLMAQQAPNVTYSVMLDAPSLVITVTVWNSNNLTMKYHTMSGWSSVISSACWRLEAQTSCGPVACAPATWKRQFQG